MKKRIVLALTLMLSICLVFVIAANANASPLTVTASEVNAIAGQMAEVDVKLSNNTGFVSNTSVARTENKKDLISTITKWGSLTCILLIIVGFCMYAFSFVRDLSAVDNNNNPTQYVIEPNTEVPSNVVDTLSVTDTSVLKSTK